MTDALPSGSLPGFLATNGRLDGVRADAEVARSACGPVDVAYWGLDPLDDGPLALALSRVTRTTSGHVPAPRIAAQFRQDPAALMQFLPPFAAVGARDDGVELVADSMGFRQLYHTVPGEAGAAAMSTSALALAGREQSGLDAVGVAVQSLLGWQLGQRTLFSGVAKLSPGMLARLGADGLELASPAEPERGELDLRAAVQAAAALLRESLNAVLDDHPDAVLQLTGGQDSRLLLSAVPRARRRGLRAMTLGVPDSGDAVMAARIAELYGLRHEVHPLSGLDGLGPEEAWSLVRAAAVRLDAMSDPVALAALGVGEAAFEQGVRISGLGGEVARGFYYVGRVADRPVTRGAAEQLAAWRMFVNEAVEPGLLDTEFSGWAREAANGEVFAALSDGGKEWFRATDQLYLRHRMQRWAGVTDTAVGYQRVVINPMLDEGFLAIATRLSPSAKAGSRFLASLQMELDPELGRMPLEGRPAPAAYASPGPWQVATRTLTKGRSLARKVVQRLQRANRAPAGGAVLAAKVTEHWRADPDVLVASAAATGIVRSEWLSEVLDGRRDPRPSSVAFLTNLLVASETAGAGMVGIR